MSFVRERFNPVPMAANSSYIVRGPHIGGFLAKTAGNITVSGFSADGSTAVTFVDAVPLTAGFYTPIPLISPSPRSLTVTLAGGASGTLFV
jgi:hypothetical protein